MRFVGSNSAMYPNWYRNGFIINPISWVFLSHGDPSATLLLILKGDSEHPKHLNQRLAPIDRPLES